LVLEDFLAGSLDLKAPKLVVYNVGNTLWKAGQGTASSPYCENCLSKVNAVRIGALSIKAKLVQSVKPKSLSLFFLNISHAFFS